MIVWNAEAQLCAQLRQLPQAYGNKYNEASRNQLIELLFRSLTGWNPEYLHALFPNGLPPPGSKWSLKEAQGAIEGAEYTEAARGHPCGHIFKSGEATYRCKTCTDDETCVLCSRCYDASDHEGHMVFVSMSPGNSGCCDCGDDEAWNRPVNCTIHTRLDGDGSRDTGKAKAGSPLPAELIASIRGTIAKALDYFCDVWSCSPEQQRLPKTADSIREDERQSRLHVQAYGEEDLQDEEFALVLWNDEKHTVNDVRDVVQRACRTTPREGVKKAHQVDEVGRTVLTYSRSVESLLRMAKIIEQPKLTVTIRSARDTFRECMCETIIEWILDIAGCSVGPDHEILRNVICEELLGAWTVGSIAHRKLIGEDGLDDHEAEDMAEEYLSIWGRPRARLMNRTRRAQRIVDEGTIAEEADGTEPNVEEDIDMIDVEGFAVSSDPDDLEITDNLDDALEESEATLAGYPPPPPPPLMQGAAARQSTAGQPDASDTIQPPMRVPKTPKVVSNTLKSPITAGYWLDRPEAYGRNDDVPLCENLWQRVRLDFLILYDMRMWKKLRSDIRDVLISTVVTVPYFKRMLGLRFAGVYTVLAELYLIADREPDHSIVNLSLQMLTTPSITAEVVERGNFLTNLMAILYTFLTTRQVGYPANVNLRATLEFDQGAVGNRRIHQFYHDMQHLLGSEQVQERIRSEERYLLQFLDLVKLHQGICPNERQVGEHIEYEADAWIQASVITSEIMKLGRKLAETFVVRTPDERANLCSAIRTTARVTTINSLGAERSRFAQNEIKDTTKFKSIVIQDFDSDGNLLYLPYTVVDYVVADEPMSFHHSLHYTLSWLIDKAKMMPAAEIRQHLLFTTSELTQASGLQKAILPENDPDENLLALFDFPIRVCAWLAQMKAGMWVRNGITLRHQMATYRSSQKSNYAYHRDLFLIQTALVVCNPARVLASIATRYGMVFATRECSFAIDGADEQQKLEIAEDLVHLLIGLLSDRTSLRTLEEDPEPKVSVTRRDIIHALCFKSLSYSEITNKMSERISDSEEFASLLDELTTFKAPEGLSDTGQFSLKDQYYDEIDPYLAWFSRNQRDEAESIYRKQVAQRLGKNAADIVFVPKLSPIKSGLFTGLANFVQTPLFAQLIHYFLTQVASHENTGNPPLATTRIEQFLSFVVHLVLVALVAEETSAERTEDADGASFSVFVLQGLDFASPYTASSAGLLKHISEQEAFKSCEAKIQMIFKRLKERSPTTYASWLTNMNLPAERSNNNSPAPSIMQDKELKKKQALERQARIMAQMKQQQANFLENQMDDWDDDDDLSDSGTVRGDKTTESVDQQKTWKFPSGTCILCQEETNDSKLCGTFALINESAILRQTDFRDAGWVQEVLETPQSLDVSAESIRPFGVAGDNKRTIHKVTAEGRDIVTERQELSRGFPSEFTERGPVASGCGHIMHFSCFEVFLDATLRRHHTQIARNHPERIEHKEFLCPLCKALGNAFLPIIWKPKQLPYPGVLEPSCDYDAFIEAIVPLYIQKLTPNEHNVARKAHLERLLEYGNRQLTPTHATTLNLVTKEGSSYTSASSAAGRPRNFVDALFNQQAPPPPPPMVFQTGATLAPPIDPIRFLDRQFATDSQDPFISGPPPPWQELIKIYQRLRETVTANKIPTPFKYPNLRFNEDLVYTDVLSRCLGHSISAVEIAQRGVEADSSNFLASLSTQTLTHLRVLSETVTSYSAFGALRNNGNNDAAGELSSTTIRQLVAVFYGHPQLYDAYGPNLIATDQPLPQHSMLGRDAFIHLSELVENLVPCLNLDVHHVMRLCYLAEMVRVMSSFLTSTVTVSTGLPDGQPISEAMVRLVRQVYDPDQNTPAMNVRSEQDTYTILQRLLNTYALPFLRKCLILMNVKYGVDFPREASSPGESELNRLAKALRLPVPDQLFADALNSPTTIQCMRGWLDHHGRVEQVNRKPVPSHPAIFELVGLPNLFSTLQEEVMKKKCPKNGKELSDPSLCLFCGEIFCGQANCCANEENQGGCWQHRQKCGGNIGIFINIRKCMVLLLNGRNGSWFLAPYLDKYGEVDPALRRHQQLYLNQKRYDALLRHVWLQHQVQSTIARKLEGDSNTGGWETL